jgi:PAS domain S-box-containing protein
LEQLRVQHEELAVADEELRAQLDELGRNSQRLELERQRYRDLFDFAPDALFVTDRNGLVKEANLAATIMLEISQRFLRGRPITTFIARENVAEFRTALATLASCGPVEVEVTLSGRRGAAWRVAFTGSLTSEGNRLLWTARRALESATVETIVDERTHYLRSALEERDMLLNSEREARDALESASRMKEGRTACTSRELRAPLHNILGWVQMLRDEGLDDPKFETALSIIERNARAQAALIEQLAEGAREPRTSNVKDVPAAE